MKKSKLTPDPLRDSPNGDYQAPGSHCILPARSYADNRFNQYPMTFRVLGVCSAHASSFTGTFFTNQKTLADICQCSQQAISHHMTKLIQWGYLEKIRNQDVRRAYGKKGAIWRVVYDPTKTIQDSMKRTHKDEKVEQLEAKETLDFINGSSVDKFVGNNVGLVQDGDCNSNKNKVDIVPDNKPQLVNNYNRLTYKDNISENDCKQICQIYAGLVQKHYGRPWSYDFRQMDIAKDLLSLMDKAIFEDVADRLLDKMKKNHKPAPHSLLYFVRMKQNKGEPMDAQAIVKMMAARMKLPR